VVDARLRVHGIAGLRITMLRVPTYFRQHQRATIMVAEKGGNDDRRPGRET